MRGTTLDHLQTTLADANIRHFAFSFPIHWDGDDTFCGDAYTGDTFRFDTFGLDYTAYRTGGDSKRYRTLWAAGLYQELAELINDDWSQLSERKRSQTLIAATFGGVLVGLMTNYSEVDHSDLIKALKDVDLHESIEDWALDLLCLRIWITVSIGDRFLASFRITNGHSGHVAFGYAASFRVGEFEFDIPLTDRVRHLTNVHSTLANLNELFKAAQELRIADTLRETEAGWLIDKLIDSFSEPTKRQAEVLESVKSIRTDDNALVLAVWLGEWTEKRGYKGVASQMLSIVMNEVFPK